MKLRALELEQFRKFDRAVRISGFGDRVNVLSGPNEFGKSTVLAAIRGLLFERHSSKAEPIKRMQSWRGNAAPRIAMEFETGGGLWRIEKRFLHQPMARLTAPDGARFDNDAAEERLQALLGFGAAGKLGARPEQMGVWGALWVTQRDSVLQPDLTSDLARATITGCLDAEVGVMTGNEKGQAIIRLAREQLGQLLDGNGRPKGRYREVTTTIQAHSLKLAELRDRARRLAEDVAELQQQTRLLERESDPAAEQRDQMALEDARRRREAALLHQNQMETATSALALAERNWRDAEAERQRRADRAEKLRADEAALAAAHQAASRAEAAATDAEAMLASQRAAADAALARATRAAQEIRRLREVADMVRRAAAVTARQQALAQAEAQQDRVNDMAARLGTMRVTHERMEAIRKAAREHDTAVAVRDAQATTIAFELLPGAAERVRVAGLPPASEPMPLIEDTEIAVEGIGKLRVRPAIRDRDKLLRRLAAAEQALATALAEAACASVAEAEQRRGECETLERDLADARAALARLVPGETASGLAPGIAALAEHVAQETRLLDAQRSQAGLEALPSMAQAASDSRAAEEEDMAAAAAAAEARAELDGATERRSTAREARVRADEQARTLRNAAALLAEEAREAEAREPAEALASRVAGLEQERVRCGSHLAALERDRPQDTAEAMQARIDRYEQSLRLRQQNVRRLRETIAALRARIAQEGGNGLDEQIATMEREIGSLQQEQAACLRDAQTLTLLRDTLNEAERETKERYLAPVIRRVTPYLRSLFPGADISCDDTLRVTGLARERTGEEDFDRLSDGTQEQVAVLARLAFAEMLVDQGKPAMVILDDALAYSDAERMERMFDVLTQAAQKTQIMVLTCREDLFARLGGNRLELAASEPAAG